MRSAIQYVTASLGLLSVTLHQHKPSIVSADYLSSSRRFTIATNIVDEFERTSLKANYLLQLLDPAQYEALERLREAAHAKYPYARALDAIDPLLQEGRAIMWNRQTPLHADVTDPVNAWVTLFTLGRFTKGHLFVRRLNLRLFYEPGALVVIKGHILPHEVEVWEGGQRISVVHFTHESLWREFGMTCP
jgi:hypothetical protein